MVEGLGFPFLSWASLSCQAGVRAASALLGRPVEILPNTLQMELSLWQSVARFAVLLFFQSFIHLGSLQCASLENDRLGCTARASRS